MAFSIELLPDVLEDPELDGETRWGRIVLGDFQERFLAAVTFWREEDYAKHWREALTRILSGAETSCLITSIADPASPSSSGLWWWPLYREGDTVVVHNAMLLFEWLDEPFDISNPYTSVPPRRTKTDEGEPLSEWEVSGDDIAQFLAALAPDRR